MGICFICTDKNNRFMGVFSTRDTAERSWGITHSNTGYPLHFKNDDVLTESAGFGLIKIGQIKSVEILTKAGHL